MPLEEKGDRAKRLQSELTRFVDVLAAQDDVSCVVVFGSLASESVDDESDLDMMIVSDTDDPFIKRLQKVRRLLCPKVATDFLVYNPREVTELWKTRPFVRDEILKHGKVLYERERGTLARLCA